MLAHFFKILLVTTIWGTMGGISHAHDPLPVSQEKSGQFPEFSQTAHPSEKSVIALDSGYTPKIGRGCNCHGGEFGLAAEMPVSQETIASIAQTDGARILYHPCKMKGLLKRFPKGVGELEVNLDRSYHSVYTLGNKEMADILSLAPKSLILRWGRFDEALNFVEVINHPKWQSVEEISLFLVENMRIALENKEFAQKVVSLTLPKEGDGSADIKKQIPESFATNNDRLRILEGATWEVNREKLKEKVAYLNLILANKKLETRLCPMKCVNSKIDI